ncbi:Hypothetical predicted protein [Octopus vulgaris]|uniref:Uncharacterized protein n=1 Tax=Octopus vulgaris TaxID=6645 RepID=A0AA36BNX5_OCTVU|nr:Hypothetical predicted protein [Octopus vulgaris]
MASDCGESSALTLTSVTTGYEVIQQQFQDLLQLKDFLINKTTELSSKASGQSNSRNESATIMSDFDNSKSSTFKGSEILDSVVSWKQYESVAQELEIEKLNHCRTKTRCCELTDHLEISQQQIAALQKQIQDDRESFRRILNSLNKSVKLENEKKCELETRCSQLEEQNKKLDEKLASRISEVKKLKGNLLKQKELQSRNLMELEVNRCQQDYISNYLDQCHQPRIKKCEQNYVTSRK